MTDDAMRETKETAPAFLRRLGDNAAAWAVEFRKVALNLGYSDMDKGWLIGWFANAIENSHVKRTTSLLEKLKSEEMVETIKAAYDVSLRTEGDRNKAFRAVIEALEKEVL